jgi:uncharacterized DUF497 family protein
MVQGNPLPPRYVLLPMPLVGAVFIFATKRGVVVKLKFEWDPEKNKKNNRKHRVDFNEAETVFEDDKAIEMFDEEHSEDEERFIIIGISTKERELMVCYCERDDGEVIRIIYARKATISEKELYERGSF